MCKKLLFATLIAIFVSTSFVYADLYSVREGTYYMTIGGLEETGIRVKLNLKVKIEGKRRYNGQSTLMEGCKHCGKWKGQKIKIQVRQYGDNHIKVIRYTKYHGVSSNQVFKSNRMYTLDYSDGSTKVVWEGRWSGHGVGTNHIPSSKALFWVYR